MKILWSRIYKKKKNAIAIKCLGIRKCAYHANYFKKKTLKFFIKYLPKLLGRTHHHTTSLNSCVLVTLNVPKLQCRPSKE